MDTIHVTGDTTQTIFSDDAHILIFDNANVTVYGTGDVSVYDEAHVTLYGEMEANFFGKATGDVYTKGRVSTYSKSSINTYWDTTVCAYENSHVFAYNNSTVYARDNTMVDAHHYSTVYGSGAAIIIAYLGPIVYAGQTVIVFDREPLGNKNIHAATTFDSNTLPTDDTIAAVNWCRANGVPTYPHSFFGYMCDGKLYPNPVDTPQAKRTEILFLDWCFMKDRLG